VSTNTEREVEDLVNKTKLKKLAMTKRRTEKMEARMVKTSFKD
jgi:hypothetical protein